MDTTTYPNIQPLDGGTVPQVMVHFLGPQRGEVILKGPATGRKYRYDATSAYFWVHRDDLPHVRRFPYFEVLDHTAIDPAVDELNRMVAEKVDAQLRKVAGSGLNQHPRRSSGRGRPRISDDDLRRILHLRFHLPHPWNAAQIAADYASESVDPAAMIRKRLERARKLFPESPGDDCNFCRERFEPPPPVLPV